MPSPENPGLTNWTLIVLLSMIWGAAFMSISLALEGYPPRTVAAARIGLAALTLWLLGGVIRQPLRSISASAGLRGWIFCATIGVVAVASPFTLLSWGQQHVPSAFAGVAMGTGPLLVLPLVYMFSPDEGIGPRRIMGMILGFVGLIVLIGPGALDGGRDALTLWGRLACLGAAACYAIGSVMTRRAPKMPPIALATGSMVVAALVTIPVALISDGLPQAYPVSPTLALLYAALFPTALAAIIRIHVITTAGSLFMSLSSYIVPLWSVFFGIVLMGETLSRQLFAALGLILLGIAISQSRAIMAALRRG